jgi:hypothetical protein
MRNALYNTRIEKNTEAYSEENSSLISQRLVINSVSTVCRVTVFRNEETLNEGMRLSDECVTNTNSRTTRSRSVAASACEHAQRGEMYLQCHKFLGARHVKSGVGDTSYIHQHIVCMSTDTNLAMMRNFMVMLANLT